MYLKPQSSIEEHELNRALHLVIVEGLTTEAMTVFTQGVFLVSMALLLGASNFQIGLLAAMPTFTNIFQLVSIWLVKKYNNRRAVSVWCSVAARLPLIIIGILLLSAKAANSLHLVIVFLLFYVRLHCGAELECMDERPCAGGSVRAFFFAPQQERAGAECIAQPCPLIGCRIYKKIISRATNVWHTVSCILQAEQWV